MDVEVALLRAPDLIVGDTVDFGEHTFTSADECNRLSTFQSVSLITRKALPFRAEWWTSSTAGSQIMPPRVSSSQATWPMRRNQKVFFFEDAPRGETPISGCFQEVSGWPKTHSPSFHYGEPPSQMFQPILAFREANQQPRHLFRRGVLVKLEHHDTVIERRRIVTNIRKIKITGDQHKMIALRVFGDRVVRRIAHPSITDIRGLILESPEQDSSGARQAGVNQKMHVPRSGWQRMMLFLVNQVACELQGGADVLNGQVVFPLHFLEAHAASKAAYDD